jgi:catechol 2,3-dioxygenase-like lactoylglutathione lyase family enzyme
LALEEGDGLGGEWQKRRALLVKWRPATVDSPPIHRRRFMDIGAFSVSLAVEDMATSRDFYEKLGFDMVAGDGESWTIVSNGTHVIGLFQGMFEGNILTFNPGWSGVGQPADEFIDIRELRDTVVLAGLELGGDTTADTPSGPASFTLTDPDGNAILVDQHV